MSTYLINLVAFFSNFFCFLNKGQISYFSKLYAIIIFSMFSSSAFAVTINSLTFNPTTVVSGGSATLSWRSTGSFCNINGSYLAATGSKTYTNLTSTKTVVVTCGTPMGGSKSKSATVTVGVPTAPKTPSSMSVSTTSTTASAITTSWARATGTVTRYEAQRRFNNGSWSNYYSNTGTSATSPSMSVGNWAFRVRACNTVGCSSYRSAANVVIKHRVPGVPSSMSITPTSTTSSSVSASWGAASGYVTRYEGYRRNGQASWQRFYSGSSRTAPSSSMDIGYWAFKVRACNSTGCSSYRNGNNVTIKLGKPAMPSSMSVSATSTTANAITTSWAKAVGTVTRYEAQRRFNSGSWSNYYSGTARSKASSSMNVGTWSFRVRACNGVGCSSYKNSANVIVKHAIPNAPASMTVPGSTTSTSITSSWASASGYVTRYEAQRKFNGGAWSNYYSGSQSSSLSSSMTIGTWGFRVRACNSEGCSTYRDGGNVEVKHPIPSLPEKMVISPKTTWDDKLNVTWDAASGHLTKYQAQRRNVQGDWQIFYSGLSNSVQSMQMEIGSWAFRVRACNDTGCSDYKTGNNATVQTKATPPSITYNTTLSTEQLTVSWEKVFAPVSRYELQEVIDSGSWSEIYVGTSTNYTVSELMASTRAYRVRACIDAICGNWRTGSSQNIQAPAEFSLSKSLTEDGQYSLTWNINTVFGAGLLVEQRQGATWQETTLAASGTKNYNKEANGIYTYYILERDCRSGNCTTLKQLPNQNITVNIPTPSIPTGFEVSTALGASTAHFSWQASDNSPTSYQLTKSKDQVNWSNVSSGIETNSSVANLPTGNWYFRLRACRYQICSDYTTTSAYLGLTKPILTAPAITTGLVEFQWSDANASSKFSRILDVTNSTQGVDTGAYVERTVTGQTSIIKSTNGTYKFVLQEYDDSTTPADSNVPIITELVRSEEITVEVEITGIPANMLLPENTISSYINTRWDIANGDVSHYEAERRFIKGDGTWSNWDNYYIGPDSAAKSSSMTLGEWEFRVKACNAEDCSEYRYGSHSVEVKRPPPGSFSGKVIFIHTDLLGSPVAETDVKGDVQ